MIYSFSKFLMFVFYLIPNTRSWSMPLDKLEYSSISIIYNFLWMKIDLTTIHVWKTFLWNYNKQYPLCLQSHEGGKSPNIKSLLDSFLLRFLIRKVLLFPFLDLYIINHLRIRLINCQFPSVMYTYLVSFYLLTNNHFF